MQAVVQVEVGDTVADDTVGVAVAPAALPQQAPGSVDEYGGVIGSVDELANDGPGGGTDGVGPQRRRFQAAPLRRRSGGRPSPGLAARPRGLRSPVAPARGPDGPSRRVDVCSVASQEVLS